jgi:hypothetical protein
VRSERGRGRGGQGGGPDLIFFQVYLARKRDTAEILALKKIPKTRYDPRREDERIGGREEGRENEEKRPGGKEGE